MEKIWSAPGHPASFSSVARLAKHARVKRDTAAKFLSAQDAYTLTKPFRKRFPRRRFLCRKAGELLIVDLLDISQLSWHNKGVKFILVACDCLSKKVFYVP